MTINNPQVSKTKVFLVGFWPDYETDFLSDITLESFDVRIFNPMKDGAFVSAQQWIPRFIRNKIYSSKINKLISENKKDSLFIFQEHRLIMETVLQCKEKIKYALLFRNPIAGSQRTLGYLEQLRKQGCLLWSFDEADCKKYDLNYYPQIIDYVENTVDEKTQYDFAFVGRDKGRKKILDELSKRLKEMNYTVFMDIRGSDKNDQISYEQYLKEICSAKCIIDIVQDKQAGITLRPLEGFIYKRKVLTNNQQLKKLDIYDADNIYLIDENLDLSGITDFLQKPLSEKPKQYIEQHMSRNVVERIAIKLLEI